MSELSPDMIVGVVGAGAMGSGIAQVAAAAGHRVVIADARAGATETARASLVKTMGRDVEKKRRSQADADALIARVTFEPAPVMDAASLDAFRDCGLVVEAIVEDLGAKRALFAALESVVGAHAVLATNTSSLSVTSIASACKRGERVLGLHFFNPAPVLPLVEVIPWRGSRDGLADSAVALMNAWGKVPVVASDTPGFIVNRVARPYYSESLRILEEMGGTPEAAATIDWAMREIGGFKMGPFELMDFIGNDVNFAVTRSVYEGFFNEPRYRPSVVQQRLVEAGYLGRKSGRGYYSYAEGASMPTPDQDRKAAKAIFERVHAMLVTEAVEAVALHVASPRDIDLAMTKGVNYPKGLLVWGMEVGFTHILERMEALYAEYREDRYRPSRYMRVMGQNHAKFDFT